MRKGWDLTSTNSLNGAAEWIRKHSGATLVLVVRSGDIAFAVDPAVSPSSARDMVEFVMPEVQQQLQEKRLAARQKEKRSMKKEVTDDEGRVG